jgi:hypothetical protein
VGSEAQKPTALQGLATQANTAKPPRFGERSGGLKADLGLDGGRDLHKPAASGVEGLTAAAYPANWPANITAVVHRRNTPRARATLVRRCDLPKATGADRPLGMPARADPRVPLAGATRVMAIDAQDWLEGSDG